ncbi:hypothetical protein BB558_007320 [Smittium angustum]|uniref:Carbohydrate-binding module family 19 domain-containing protein n=1 Tax=Smittium angustum TaxID=133377 RepID=A0A2U1IVB6_SMIAN|nr:hypothetical protein BB558_007320 [Smittium angustum]
MNFKNFIFCFLIIVILFQVVFSQDNNDSSTESIDDNIDDSNGQDDNESQENNSNQDEHSMLGVRDENDHFHPPQNKPCRGFQKCIKGDNQWYSECIHGTSHYSRCPSGNICKQQGDRIRCIRR